MITPIPLDSIVYVYGTFAIDKERLLTVMPAVPLHPVLNKPVTEVAGMSKTDQDDIASMDMFQNLRQLSWSQNNGYTHLIVRPDKGEEVVSWNGQMAVPGMVNLWFVPDEMTAIRRFWEVMNRMAQFPDACILAGWKIRTELWPKLLTAGFRHGAPIDPMFKTDPMSRFSTIKVLLEVADVWSQGTYGAVRRVPELSDALDHLRIQQICPTDPHVTPNQLAAYTAQEWERSGHLQVANLLFGMQSLVRLYYA